MHQATKQADVVFFFDVDNTLLDNDMVSADLRSYLKTTIGVAAEERYWVLFEHVRRELGYADYLGTLQQYRAENLHEPQVQDISSFLLNYPFPMRLFPHALEVVVHCNQWGPVAVLSDGDVVFQPHKIESSGISKAVGGNVLIYIHKELEVEDVERRYPAKHYVLVDDKLRILTAMKAILGSRITTVFAKQGHYAHDLEALADHPPADLSVERIGDLLEVDLDRLMGAAHCS
jgi:hypothetical protein